MHYWNCTNTGKHCFCQWRLHWKKLKWLAIWIVMFNIDVCCSCVKCVCCSLCDWNILFLLFFYLWWKLYNSFPWMGKWIKTLTLLMNNVEVQVKHFRESIHQLKASLNPEMCRCLIDSFLIRKQKDEVKQVWYTSLTHVKNKAILCYFEPHCDAYISLCVWFLHRTPV